MNGFRKSGMKRINNYSLLMTGLFLMTGMSLLEAQLQFPGKPVGISRQLKVADVMYVLPPVDPMEIEAASQANLEWGHKSFYFAIERTVDLSPETHGSWESQEQNRIWRIHILSPEARSLGLVFNTYFLEPGVKVFVYDPDLVHIKGAFTSVNNKDSGILPVGHVSGEELIIEMQVPVGMTDYGQLRIESVSHAFLDTKHPAATSDCPAGVFGCSQGCEIDIHCSEGDEWQLTKRSVVRIYGPNLNYYHYCSGVLINNTAYDGMPYIITAEHCINSEDDANRSVFQFNYESPSCFGPDGPLNMSIAGAELMSVGDSLDFSLVKLSELPPENFDVYYAGWDRSDFQTSGSTAIHHPWGDVKKISSDYEIPSIPAQPGDVPYSDLDDYHYFSFWWIRGWDEGSTEGGSSGSPLFNAGNRVIGTLSGGIARCGDSIGYDSEADRVIYNKVFNYDDYYTRMSMAWDYNGQSGPSLKPWLDPANTGVVTLEGYQPTHTDQISAPGEMRYNIYPNPVTDVLFISSRDVHQGVATYRIYDISGAEIRNGNLNESGSVEIETGSFAAGVYLLRIESGKKSEHHKFIVIR